MNYNGKNLRHELKYYISYIDYIRLKTLLSKVLFTDPNAGTNGSYHIRSLYFDDIYDSALYEKNYGVMERTKYRIRIYDFSKNIIKLERKRKYSDYINKESVSLSLDEYKMIMAQEYDFLRDKGGLHEDFYRCVSERLLRPKVIVDYRREPYVLEFSDVRVTFDMDLNLAYNKIDIFAKDIITMPVLDKYIMILEVKFNEFLPNYLKDLLSMGSYGRSAISKYVLCRVLKNNIY